MNEFVMNLGYGVLTWLRSIDPSNLLTALSIMGTGMLGIFLVTGIIIAVITLLGKVFAK